MLDFGTNRNLPRVLLIDDDLVSREVMATVLTMGGYTVQTAGDGAASLDLLSSGVYAPEVILVDVKMPGLNGVELIAALRKRTQAVVVAMSASDAHRELVATADAFLLKPFGAEALEQVLRKHAQQPKSVRKHVPRAKAGKRRAIAQGSFAEEPVIKAEILRQFRQMMPESGVREIYAAIEADLNKQLGALESAIAAGDAARIGGIGHAIKGGCGMAGAMQAARLGAMLEASANDPRGNQVDNSTKLLHDLRSALDNLKSMLNSEFPV